MHLGTELKKILSHAFGAEPDNPKAEARSAARKASARPGTIRFGFLKEQFGCIPRKKCVIQLNFRICKCFYARL